MKMAEKCSLSTIAYVSWMICLKEFDMGYAFETSSDLKTICNPVKEFNHTMANKTLALDDQYNQKLINSYFKNEKNKSPWNIVINDKINRKTESDNKSINLKCEEDPTVNIFNNGHDCDYLIRNVRQINQKKNSLMFNNLKHNTNCGDKGRFVNNDNKMIKQEISNLDILKTAKLNACKIGRGINKKYNNYRPDQNRIVSGSITIFKSLKGNNSISNFKIIKSKINKNGSLQNTANNSLIPINGGRYINGNGEFISQSNKKEISGKKNKLRTKKYSKKLKGFSKKQKHLKHVKHFYFNANINGGMKNMPYNNSKKIQMSNVTKKFRNSRRKNRNNIINAFKDWNKLSSKIHFKNIQQIIDSKLTEDPNKKDRKKTTLDFYAGLLDIAKNVKSSTESGNLKKKVGSPNLKSRAESDHELDEDDDDLEGAENDIFGFFQTCVDFENNNNNTYSYFSKAITDENNLNNVIIINIRTFSVSEPEIPTCKEGFIAPTWTTPKYPAFRLLKDDLTLENNLVTASLFTIGAFTFVVMCCLTPMVIFKRKQTVEESIHDDTNSQQTINC